MVAEGLGVGDEVGRHCRLGLGLLQAPFQLRDLELGTEGRVWGCAGPAAWAGRMEPKGALMGHLLLRGGQGAPYTKASEERGAGRREGEEKGKTAEKAERGHQGSVRKWARKGILGGDAVKVKATTEGGRRNRAGGGTVERG